MSRFREKRRRVAFRWARSYLGAFRRFAGDRRLCVAALLIIGGAVLEGAGLMLLVPLLGLVSGAAPMQLRWLADLGVVPGLAHLLLLFLGLAGIRAVIIRERDIELARLRLEFVDALRNQLQSALAQADWRFLSGLGHSGILSAMLADLNRVSSGTHFLVQGVSSLGMAIAGVVVAVSVSPVLTLVVLGLALLFGFGLRSELARASVLGMRLSEAQRSFFQSATDFLGGLKLIKAKGAEPVHVERFALLASALTAKQLDFSSRQASLRAVFEIAAACFLAALVYVAFTFIHLPVAELLLVVLVFARLLPLVKTWHGQLRMLWHMLPAFISVARLLARARRAAELQPSLPSNRIELREGVKLQGVAFRYDGRTDAISDVSVTLPARRTTAIVGPSGAGKTTLADLVLGLLTPTQGRILIDDLSLAGAAQGNWRRMVGYVPQDVFLFPGSVRDNLIWFYPAATEEELWEALELAAAAAFIRLLPRGLETPVGERGARLSGGERQRIALARALLGCPQLLVLDEATSHLDAENETRIQAALASLHGRMTLLVIAHRLTTIRSADQIVVLEQGRVVQQGSWTSLSDQPGLFQHLLQPTTI